MKKIISFFLCIVLILSFSVPAFAADSGGLICPTCGSAVLVHSDTIEGIYHNIEYVCSNKECDYKRKEKKILGMESVSGATATPIEGATAPPSGYSGEGVPTYNCDGEFQLVVYPEVQDNQSILPDYVKLPTEFEFTSNSPYDACSHWKMDGMNYYGMAVSSNYASGSLNLRYVIDAPVSGLYYIKNEQDMTSTYKSGWFGKLETKRYYLAKGAFSYYLAKGTSRVAVGRYVEINLTSISGELPTNRVTFYPIVVNVIPDTPIKNRTNITINNNTWNGNIYVDNSNKLTYIYPQYTTVNENNETVTNISNNPIIYNQETKQYYTYDSVTNNYYYITYNVPTPTPTPTPTPDIPTKPIVPDTQSLIVPKMNANTFTDEHGTWVASGSSKYSDVFDFFYAFDRSTANFWETNVSPCHLQIEIPDPESYYIDGYIMRISKFNNRYSKDWTLQGSDDGETWDDLDKQTDQNLSDMEEHKYTLTLRKAYKYYRLNMSNYASTMCSLSHFNLLGYAAKDVTFPTPDPGGSTPDPGKPTPTPGGSGGGSGDTNNFWNIIIKDNNKTDKEHKGIFWALVSLLIAAITFVVNMLTAYKYLFPFLPDGVIAVINTCVAVLMIFVVIKFVMRVIK